ncbi:alpha,alpha-trehalose-phosphate synthase (UDP-forming) [Halalkalicoccus ordinarius]|uniref:alpha,alpha-trehalose-phosphate synthase (UDP-forming) n=1 Tax=Halalkalicoccus ordinarius TaxID=3116651 RepID=UPI00300F3710
MTNPGSAALSDRVTDAFSDRDLVVVSNRQPYAHDYDDGEITVSRPAGGLTAGLDPVMQRAEGTWIAWGDGDADFEVADEEGRVRVPPDDPSYTLSRVRLSEEDVEGYYYGYSNRALWPLCHGMIGTARCDGRDFEHYRQVNRRFADAVVDRIDDDDDALIWFQDYHFGLAPRMVRGDVGGAVLTQFWHIPWPTWDTFRVCPSAETIVASLLANDLLVFHTPEYVGNFLDCVEAAVPEATVDRSNGAVAYDDHTTTVVAFPLGVDAGRITDLAERDAWPDLERRHRLEDRTIALGVDRLDYTKGIPERIDALERFFEDHPERRGDLTYVQKGTGSREEIEAYQHLQDRVDRSIERVNDRFGTDDWRPIIRVQEHLPKEELYALYRHSDLALVTPLRDGMNLVAKEFVAAQLDSEGVLLLSEFAGAHEELGDDAVTINPYDTQGVADAIDRALALPEEERRERMTTLRERVNSYDLVAWMDDVLSAALDCEGNRDEIVSEHA